MGTTETVLWSSEGFVSDVTIELSADGGTSWSALVASTANDGSEDVTVPDAPSTQCLVRVKETDGEPSDESDAAFSIAVPVLAVISPNGGETWYHGGDDREITWTAANVSGNVELLYSADGGLTWQPVATVPVDDGSYTWTVPDEDSAQCLVRVQEEGGSGLSDDSDADFTITATPLPDSGVGLMGLGRASLAWGDYDSDGDLDLVITGESAGSASLTRLYRNEGGGSFSELDPGMIGARHSGIAWGDYDSDGDLDLAGAGQDLDLVPVSTIYRNECAVSNTLPSVPVGLSAAAAGGDVTFNWNAATDAETPQAGLSYNLRVGTAPGGEDVFCGMADSTSGFRRIPALGNAQENLSWALVLPTGTYFWSVQAVDTAFAGSAWAPEETVVVP